MIRDRLAMRGAQTIAIALTVSVNAAEFWSGVNKAMAVMNPSALSTANYASNELSQFYIRRISCRSNVCRRDAAIPVRKRAGL
jgi:hypothetical protein